jgi:hypothetical protein
MTRRLVLSLFVLLIAIPPARAGDPLRGVLVEAKRVTPGALATWKAKGINAVVVPLDEATRRDDWAALAGAVERSGLALYPWVEVARNPAMADAHPDWMAAPGGHHDDWRRRFPDAPKAQPGKVIKAWPWVPIGYAPAFEAHRKRLFALLDDLPGAWAGVFLNDLQGGPSSCGCGNDQCRWALDYGSPSTAPKTPGDDAAARLVAGLRQRHPGKVVVPVWVTECQLDDLPNVPGSTGHCGGVPCAKNDCWPRYARNLGPLLKATPGPVAVALWRDAFGRDRNWEATGVAQFLRPPRGDASVPEARAIAVVQGWDRPDPLASPRPAPERAGGGWVVALTEIDQSWRPRLIDAPAPR